MVPINAYLNIELQYYIYQRNIELVQKFFQKNKENFIITKNTINMLAEIGKTKSLNEI